MDALSGNEASDAQVQAAAKILKSGGVVAIPTDTLYGLAASPFDDAAVERIFRLKGRPKGMAIPLLLADAADISRWAADVPAVTWALVEKFWPGALTLVFRKSPAIPDLVSAGTNTIALRVPDHWVPRALAHQLGGPITGTSANRSSSPGLTTATAVQEELGGEVDLVLDVGKACGGLASTVLDLSGESPRLLRVGAVAPREIEKLCNIRIAV